MTPDIFNTCMQKILNIKGKWNQHIYADHLILSVLKEQGFGKGVDTYINLFDFGTSYTGIGSSRLVRLIDWLLK